MDQDAGIGFDTAGLTPGERRLLLAAVFASAATFGLAFGGFAPLVALALENRGVDSMLIGANSAMSAVGVITAGFIVPSLIRRIGAANAFFAGSALTFVSMMLYTVSDSLPFWFVLRFVGGFGVAAPWVVAETWINIAANKRNRGRVMALYATLMAVGFAAGPLILTAVGSEGSAPFHWFAGIFAASALPLVAMRGKTPDMSFPGHANPLRLAVVAPTIFAAAFVSGLMDTAVFSFLPLYGLHQGLDETRAVTLLTLFLAGNLVLQVPIGMISDRLAKRTVLVGCAAGCIAGPLALPHVMASVPMSAAVLFLWGGCTWALYTVALAILGDRFRSGELAVANAAFMMAFEVGNVIGPAASGVAFKFDDGNGLLYGMAGAATVFFVVVVGRGLVALKR